MRLVSGGTAIALRVACTRLCLVRDRWEFGRALFAWYNAGNPDRVREELMIRGTKTRLRALEHNDLSHFVRWINDPEVRRFLIMRYPLSMTEEEKWWEGFLQRQNDHIFAIEAEDGTHIGNIGLHDIQRENRRAVLGIIIGDKRYWGRGYGTDAIRAMLGWGFRYLNLNRVTLQVYSYNERAIHCYQKCGFRHEGTMRQARYVDGQYFDEWVMGILRDEFLAGQKERPC
jgi:RimJ/RimL family protein N-acetyltransferase